VTRVVNSAEQRLTRQSRQLWNELAIELAAFSLLAASIVLLWRHNIPLFIVVLMVCLASLGLWHERYDLTFFLIIGVVGSIAEAVFVQFGVWRYANPTTLGIPLWFPVAFGTAALIGERLVRTINLMWEEASSLRASKG